MRAQDQSIDRSVPPRFEGRRVWCEQGISASEVEGSESHVVLWHGVEEVGAEVDALGELVRLEAEEEVADLRAEGGEAVRRQGLDDGIGCSVELDDCLSE